MHLLILLGLFTDQIDLSYTWSLKKVPLSGGASPLPVLAIIGSTPPPTEELQKIFGSGI